MKMFLQKVFLEVLPRLFIIIFVGVAVFVSRTTKEDCKDHLKSVLHHLKEFKRNLLQSDFMVPYMDASDLEEFQKEKQKYERIIKSQKEHITELQTQMVCDLPPTFH